MARISGGDLRSLVVVVVVVILGFIALSGPLAPLRILLFPQVETTGLHGIDIAVSGLTGAPPLLIALAWSGAVISLRQLIGGFQPNKAISEKVVRLFRFEIATNQ